MRFHIYTAACLFVLLLAAPYPAAAFQASGWKQQGPEVHAEKFLDLMVEGHIDDAFKFLLGSDRTDTVAKIKFELEKVYEKDGKPLGYERLLKQRIGSSLIRVRYVLLFPTMPKSFDIYYYNPDGQGWEMRSFSYIRDIKTLFDQ